MRTASDRCSAPDVKIPWSGLGLGPVSTGNSKTGPQLARTLRFEAEAGQDRDGRNFWSISRPKHPVGPTLLLTKSTSCSVNT